MSDLLKFALVQRDETFVQRVSAAMLIYARYIDGNDMSVESKNMVDYVMENPLVPVREMVLTVAVNGTVTSKVSVAKGVADASGVPDTDITYVVESQWNVVAAKAFPAVP